MKKKYTIILILIVVISMLGISYAWFNYRGEISNQRMVSGDIYLRLTDGLETISMNNIYPMTKEEARSLSDNFVTFTISGKNTSSKNVYYEIFLNYGLDKESPYVRFDDEDLVFDLIEIGNNNEETYLLDAVSYDTLDNRKIWIDTVVHDTNSVIERTYKLRMWLSDRVVISDTDVNADYTAEDFRNHYASIKFGVSGDLKEKSLPSSAITRDSYVENGKSYFLTNLTNDYLLEEEGELLDENDTVNLEITNPENKLYFGYVDSRGNEDYNNNTSLNLTYVYNKNETVNIKVFTTSRNDSNVKTTLHFKVTKNGNIVQEYNKEIDVIGNNFCLNNGFTKLGDCILVTENLSNNVSSAKTFINSKGSPDVNSTAPTYTYVEEQIENQTYIGGAGYPKWSSGEKYVFNSSTGTFTLKISDGTTDATTYVDLSNDILGKYTCGTSGNGILACSTIYKISSIDVANNKITGTKITYKITSSLDSEQGLYKVDDKDGDSYIFRGNVTNNNVYFGGYYWKIIRINGNNSIRMIFNGNTLAPDGNKNVGTIVTSISNTSANNVGGTYTFNEVVYGPTYVGYMTTEESNYWMTSSLGLYTNIAEDTAYYFSDDFESYTDEYGNKMFKLKGNVYQSKVKDLTQSQIDAKPYTCSGTNSNLICPKLVKVNSRVNNAQIMGNYISYSPNYETNSSITKMDLEQNIHDSNAKRQIDIWYQNAFSNNINNNKNVTDYLADSLYCNDRSIPEMENNNSGYLLTQSTYYAARLRFFDNVASNKMATLSCEKNDAFSVTETSTTNGKLSYPIGLITADEVALAGGKYNEKNENFYLKSNGYYWTITPAYYSANTLTGVLWNVYPNGMIATNDIINKMGLRPVINLKSDTKISMGDGTATNPYQIN